MSILSQALEVAYNNLQKEIPSLLSTYLSVEHWQPSALNYGYLVGYIDRKIHDIAREWLKNTLEAMDKEYRNSDARKAKYNVKATRNRTIITLFGEITYQRTEYQNKKTKKAFCYIDRKIGLEKRIRYDHTIAALAYEMYANHNSMIKVGELLGDRIFGFSLDEQKYREVIPRQTIWRMVHRFKEIAVPYPPEEHTPKTLYIMADEKYISLQGKNKPSNKMMTKIGVSFEGLEGPNKRKKLKNTKYIYNQIGKIWDNIYTHINQIYDIDQIENIYILGDGASWIKAGKNEFVGSKFGLCKFHFKQAVENITNDENIKNLIIDYAIHEDRTSLKKLFKSIKEQNPSREEVLTQKTDYILNNIHEIHTMYKEIKIGCPMEQAIQHVLQSPFTSVPKAYSEKYLPTYVNTRINFMNKVNLRKTYLIALDNPTEDNRITLTPQYSDYTVSNKTSLKETYTVRLPHHDAYNIFKK